MKFAKVISIIVLSIIASVSVVSYMQRQESGASAAKESAYDRVLRTGIIRCGYADWPPYAFKKDPTTGKVSGILADVAEAVGAKLKILKVIGPKMYRFWWCHRKPSFSHRVDTFCAGLWRNAARGRYAMLIRRRFFTVQSIPYVPIDEHRFDSDLSAANSPDVRISGMDGEMSDVIAKEHFPRAKEISIHNWAQPTDMLINVADHKADIVFNEPSFVDDFIKANPG
jgi:ABC-type amino acid transport substrate-binding protein